MRPVTVIKIGGGLVGSLGGFWQSVKALMTGHDVVIVHGGGPQATAMVRRLGHEPVIVHGRRVTSDLDLDIVRWVMRGEINQTLSAQAQAAGCQAVGVSGADAGLVRVAKRPAWDVDGVSVDFGWVGDVLSVNDSILRSLCADGFLPIVASLGIDESGAVYNVNADTIAAAIARQLRAARLLLVTETGCLKSREGARVDLCNRGTFEGGVADGWISDGMRVKIQLGLEALDGGVAQVWVAAPEDIERCENATRIVP